MGSDLPIQMVDLIPAAPLSRGDVHLGLESDVKSGGRIEATQSCKFTHTKFIVPMIKFQGIPHPITVDEGAKVVSFIKTYALAEIGTVGQKMGGHLGYCQFGIQIRLFCIEIMHKAVIYELFIHAGRNEAFLR